MSSKTFLVPHDFTEVGSCAADHAVRSADVIGDKICLLHVVDKSDKIEDAKRKLSAEAERLKTAYPNVEVETMVRIGNIFDDIGDAASEIDAELIFMGTHGAKGWQHLTGSHALKVITHSSVPFIVVQKKGIKPSGYDDIVVPLDLSKETKQKLELVADMAKYFNSKLHLITPNETDEYLKNQLTRNLRFAKSYLSEKGISFETTVAESSKFVKEIIKYAKSVDADLITIMNLQKNSLMGMMGSTYEQNLITNEAEIPVMIVNPLTTTIGRNVLFS